MKQRSSVARRGSECSAAVRRLFAARHYEFQTRLFKQIELQTLPQHSAAGAAPSLLTWALPQEQSVDGSRRRRNDSALLPLRRSRNPGRIFQHWLTPVPHFFVRNHMHEPSELDATTGDSRLAEKWRSRSRSASPSFPKSRPTRSSTRSSAPATVAICIARKSPAFSGARAR
jgi:hypothetical protein